MGKRPRRQVVLFLVEGDSERLALQDRIAALFDEIDESIEVFFPEIFQQDPEDPNAIIETGGDITQMYTVYPGNYDEKVYEYFLRDFCDIKKILPKDIKQIYQLVDMDGAYIPKGQIREYENPENAGKPHYGENEIVCKRQQSLISRHKRKRLNLDYLKTKKTIKVGSKTIPFEVYFFSSNLDHFIHHEANLPDVQKTYVARCFSDGFIGDTEGFANVFLKDPDSTIGDTYEESWTQVTEQDSLYSLQRHTNFNLLIEKLMKR
jgi:hypothetical protein